ncbi:MAG: sugar-binding protein [Planctomycetota bacterium]
MKGSLLLLVVLTALSAFPAGASSPGGGGKDRTKRVYLMGSSLTDQVKYRGLEALARSRGYEHIWGRHMVPGAPIRWLWNHRDGGNSKRPFGPCGKALAEYEWDAITLEPRNGYGAELKAANELIDFAVKKSPDLQVYIFAQWPRIGLGSFDTQWLSPVKDIQNNIRLGFEEFLTDVRKAHPDMKPPLMIPVGHAFHLLQLKIKAGLVPGMDSIFDGYSDRSHQNYLGEYIVGCTFFATIYGENPVGLPTEPYGPIPAGLARTIQQTVWEAVNAHPRSGVATEGDLKVVTPYLPPAIQGSPYDRELLAAFGKSPVTFSLGGGELPHGLRVAPEGRIAGQATSTGRYEFTVQAVDADGRKATRAMTLEVVGESKPVVLDQELPAMQRGRYVEHELQARGGNGDLTWTLLRSREKLTEAGQEGWKARKRAGRALPPPGLRLSPSGILSGTPGVAGTYQIVLQATDSDPTEPDSSEREFTFEVAPAGPEVAFIALAEERCAIDGKLEEPFWKVERPIKKVVEGNPSVEAKFDVVWNRSDLYMAIRVEDDNVVADSEQPWDDDGIEVYLDTKNDRQKEYNTDDKRLVISASGKVHQVGLDNPENFTVALTKTADGYIVEVQFRMNSQGMGGRNRENDAFGFDVAVNDDDDGGPRDGQLVWRGTADNATDPSGFGTILLQPATE